MTGLISVWPKKLKIGAPGNVCAIFLQDLHRRVGGAPPRHAQGELYSRRRHLITDVIPLHAHEHTTGDAVAGDLLDRLAAVEAPARNDDGAPTADRTGESPSGRRCERAGDCRTRRRRTRRYPGPPSS